MRLHDTRHSLASRLIRAGDLITVQRTLGHNRINYYSTLRYAHSLFDDKMAAVIRLDKQYEGKPEEARSAGQSVPHRPWALKVHVRRRHIKCRICGKLGP